MRSALGDRPERSLSRAGAIPNRTESIESPCCVLQMSLCTSKTDNERAGIPSGRSERNYRGLSALLRLIFVRARDGAAAAAEKNITQNYQREIALKYIDQLFTIYIKFLFAFLALFVYLVVLKFSPAPPSVASFAPLCSALYCLLFLFAEKERIVHTEPECALPQRRTLCVLFRTKSDGKRKSPPRAARGAERKRIIFCFYGNLR